MCDLMPREAQRTQSPGGGPGSWDGRVLHLDCIRVTRCSLHQTTRTTRFQGLCPVVCKFTFAELIFKMNFKTYKKVIIPMSKLLTMPVKLASLSRDQEGSSHREGLQLM